MGQFKNQTEANELSNPDPGGKAGGNLCSLFLENRDVRKVY